MDLNEIIDLNYNSTVRRGQITENTTNKQFVKKLLEEAVELSNTVFADGEEFDKYELADCMLVCTAFAKHKGINILKLMEEKAIYNSKRID